MNKKMKVLVLNPPFLPKFSRTSRSPAVSKGATIYYPIWLAYATGFLEKEGFECKLIDAPARGLGLKEVIEIAREFKPEMAVIDTSTPSIYNDVKVLEKIKESINCFCVLVGTHVSALPEESLKLSKKIDAIARKEYDYTLREVAVALRDGKNWKKIKGISYWENNKVKHNEDMPFIEDLDELPFVSMVYKKHLRIEDYFYAANLYPEITIITGRGCPNRCTYCVLPQVMNGHAYRTRSIKDVVKEFKYIKENFPQVKEVFIEDDTFPSDKPRVREFCDELVREKVKVTWSCNSRADVDLLTLKKMKKAGCRLLCVGFESGVQEILNNVKKGITLEIIRRFMKDTKKAKILVHGCFIMGNKGETKETIKKTIQLAKELEPDTTQFFPIMVYPGTEAYSYFKKEGFLETEDYINWLTKEGSHYCVVTRPELTNKELVDACYEARKQFYLRPKYFWRKLLQSITSPREIPRTAKSGKTFFKFLFKKVKK